MPNIKKAITVSGILKNIVSLSLFLILFCWLGNAYAQMPPALDFPPGRDHDPRHPRVPGEIGGQAAHPTAHKTKSLVSEANISENVELVGTTGGAVSNVFVQDNYAYICAGGTLTILDVSAPSNPTRVGYIALPYSNGVYVQGSLAYVVSGDIRIIDVSSPSSPREVGFCDTPGSAEGVYVQGGLAYVADYKFGLRMYSQHTCENFTPQASSLSETGAGCPNQGHRPSRRVGDQEGGN